MNSYKMTSTNKVTYGEITTHKSCRDERMGLDWALHMFSVVGCSSHHRAVRPPPPTAVSLPSPHTSSSQPSLFPFWSVFKANPVKVAVLLLRTVTFQHFMAGLIASNAAPTKAFHNILKRLNTY